jgi:hypothetical protein
MTRILFLLALSISILLLSCHYTPEGEKASLPDIDYSIRGPWGDSYSLKLYPSGQYILKTGFHDDDSILYFKGNLPDSIRTEILKLSDTIRQHDYNAHYSHLVMDGSLWQTIIAIEGKKYSVLIGGYSNTPFDSFPGIVWAIAHLKSNVPLDTVMEFESNIPCMQKMAPVACDATEEGRQMEAEAEKQARRGNYTYTLREPIDSKYYRELYAGYVKMKYGVKVRNHSIDELIPSNRDCFYRRANTIVKARFGDDFESRTKQEAQALADQNKKDN